MGSTSLALCNMGACATTTFITPGNPLQPGWWATYCAGGTPTTCPNGKGLSNLEHLECPAALPFQWACVRKEEAFSANPVATPWGGGLVGAQP